jgi:hypothetical protein
MPRFAVLLVILFVAACSRISVPISNAQSSEVSRPAPTRVLWNRVLDEGPWAKSYNYQIKAALPNAINNHAFLDYVHFKGAVYGLGYFNGNIEQFTFRPEIHRTRDFVKWETLSRNSNLPPRFFYHPFVFQEKIWIVGGEDKATKYADVWNSPDGIRWRRVKDKLAFGERSNSQIVELEGRLYLLNNDVWTSTNALDWERVTPEIVPGEQIFGYTAVVFDGRIWLLGCNRNGRFSSQVLVSRDGKNWDAQDAPWSPRGGIAAAVFNDMIFMTGGKYGGTPDQPNFIYSNDLWSLSKSE